MPAFKSLWVTRKRSQEWGTKIPIGLFYSADRPTYEELEPALKAGPLVQQAAGLKGKERLLDEFI